jgi:hypothetical protein
MRRWLRGVPVEIWIGLGIILLPVYLLYFAYVLRPVLWFWAPLSGSSR